jgi:AraC family transcriptional regulator
LAEIKLAGIQIEMSFSDNKTKELWESFMPRRREIKNWEGSDLYSIEVYPPLFFHNFNPGALFNKWAAIEISDIDSVPDGMETMILPAGLYAVFLYKGTSSEGPKIYQYIFETWLPKSKYIMDNRPHFAKMGEKYKNEDPDSEEEIWIPVKPRE